MQGTRVFPIEYRGEGFSDTSFRFIRCLLRTIGIMVVEFVYLQPLILIVKENSWNELFTRHVDAFHP